nr:Qat anti-phage system QueC-like protein QatC [Nitrosomonas nitrosa]
MTWHIIARVGTTDTYLPQLDSSVPRLLTTFDHPTDPAYVHNDAARVILHRLGVNPPPEALDLLHFAMSVYYADLRVNRCHGSDRWTRDFVLHLPVVDPVRWSTSAPVLTRMLQFLTGDRWAAEFRHRPPVAAPPVAAQQLRLNNIQAVSLFSGGLDSLVGAIDLLAAGRFVALVGHHGAGVTNAVQENVLNALQRYGPLAAPFMFYVQPPRSGDNDGEQSMRSRSILFLTLGVAVAATLGGGQSLNVAENGLISLIVPLSPATTGSSSTRTTHPHFLALFREFVGAVGLNVRIDTPYRFQTKGEMLQQCAAQDVLRATAPLTMSCSHPESGRFRGHAPSDHCGYCVPCIIRRASLHAAGLPQSRYSVDVTTNPPSPDTDTGRDLRAFQIALERLRNAPATRYLFDVLSTGPIPPPDAAQHAETYRRGLAEVGRLLG